MDRGVVKDVMVNAPPCAASSVSKRISTNGINGKIANSAKFDFATSATTNMQTKVVVSPKMIPISFDKCRANQRNLRRRGLNVFK